MAKPCRRIGGQIEAGTQRRFVGLHVPVRTSRRPYLAALDRPGPPSVGDLAQAFDLSQPAVTRTVSRLEALSPAEARPGARGAMTTHPLDRPAWTALATTHAAFAEGGPRARRYLPSVIPFAAAADDEPDSLRALGELVAPGESVVLLQAGDAVALPAALSRVSAAEGVQMLAAAPAAPDPDPRIERMTPADAPEMLALATLTQPGPFSLRAMELGDFWGVRIAGRLAAMAGERMRQPGFTEVSGVCAHPDFRGRGLARLLSLHVADSIHARGDTPYLHAYTTNVAAIRLYASIGFAQRSRMAVVVAARP